MARVIGKWPGVIGATHNGEVYCVDCAVDCTPATDEWLRNGDPHDLPWTAPIIRQGNFQNIIADHNCGVCGEKLPDHRPF